MVNAWKLVVFGLYSLVAYAQVNTWTWMRGNSLVNDKSHVNQSESDYGPGGRTSSSYAVLDGNFYLFGGLGYDANGNYGILGDFWFLDVRLNEFQFV